jgi:hypothetical protein
VLAAMNRDVIGKLGRRCAAEKIATRDLDATLIESWSGKLGRLTKARPDISTC